MQLPTALRELVKTINTRVSTYTKTITVLDENITNAAIAFEKSFKVFLSHSIWKASDIHPCPYHAVTNKNGLSFN